MLFPWITLERQVIIQGTAEKISTAESLQYFASRPRESQIGAWVSNQSEVITSRKFLMLKLAEIRDKFHHGEIPLPSFWGGYRVVPRVHEFWQGGPPACTTASSITADVRVEHQAPRSLRAGPREFIPPVSNGCSIL